MKKKLILAGVRHINELITEYRGLIDELHSKGVRKIGIELPVDWRNRNYKEEGGYEIDEKEPHFFIDILKYAESKGIDVVGIDSRFGDELGKIHVHATQISQQFQDYKQSNPNSNLTMEDYILQLSKSKKEELRKAKRYEREMNKRVLEVVGKYSFDQLSRRLAIISMKRSEFMINKIKDGDFDAIIVGEDHAKDIGNALKIAVYDYRSIVGHMDYRGRSDYDELKEKFRSDYLKDRRERKRQKQLDAEERMKSRLPEVPPIESSPTPIEKKKPKKKKPKRQRRRY